MYLNIDRSGIEILKPNGKYTMSLIEEFIKILPCKSLPENYLDFLLRYDTGEIESVNRLYYVKNNHILSHPIIIALKEKEILLNYFCSLPEVLHYVFQHDTLFGRKAFHRKFKLLKVGITVHDFDGIYLSAHEDFFGKVYYIDSNIVDVENIESIEGFEIASNFDELIKSLKYKKNEPN